MLWEQYREDLVFGILCGVYFALVGGHEAPSPDNQFPIFRLALAKLYEFLDGHIVAVACGVPARQFPAELEGTRHMRGQAVNADLVEVERGRPLAIR